MSTTFTDEKFFLQALHNAVKTRLQEVATEELEATNKRIASRINKELDKIALNICSEYNVRYDRGEVIIHVKKLEQPK